MDILDPRSSDILRHVVEAYLDTREPVGSRTLSKRLGLMLSPATIRNVMADLEAAGFLCAPHASAGRLPTEAGLRFFINGFSEFGQLSDMDREHLQIRCQALGKSLPQLLEEATRTLSGLSQCAGLVLAPKIESPLKHIEFVYLNVGRALVVLITEDGMVENRIIELPKGVSPSHLTEATNYLNSKLIGRQLSEVRTPIEEELAQHQSEIDLLSHEVVARGLALWGGDETGGSLIVHGQYHLLKGVREVAELHKLQNLFTALDSHESFLGLLDATIAADGVQIFIGSENPLFAESACSLIMSPYANREGKLLGAIGVIGPTYMNYRRLIPLVDYTARLLGRIVG